MLRAELKEGLKFLTSKIAFNKQKLITLMLLCKKKYDKNIAKIVDEKLS